MQGHKVVLVFRLLLLPLAHCGLLGSGTGSGSCAAPPYRSSSVQWVGGCPAGAECCTEYGYCHSRINWESRDSFRDCNGESNGTPLPSDVIRLELEERAAGRVASDDILLGTVIATSVSRTGAKKQQGRFSDSMQRVKSNSFQNTQRFSENRNQRLHGMEGNSEFISRHSFRVNSMKKGQADLRNLVKLKATTSDKSVKSVLKGTGKFGRPFAHVQANSEIKDFKNKKIQQQLDFNESSMMERAFLQSLTRSDWEKFHGKQELRMGKDVSQLKLLSQTTKHIDQEMKRTNLLNSNLEINGKISFDVGEKSKNRMTENGIFKGKSRIQGSKQSDLRKVLQKQDTNRMNAGSTDFRDFNNFDSNSHSTKNKKTGSFKGNKIDTRKALKLSQVRNGKSKFRSSHIALGIQGAVTKIHTKGDTRGKINVGPNFGAFNPSQGSNRNIDSSQHRKNMKNGKSDIIGIDSESHSSKRKKTNSASKQNFRSFDSSFKGHTSESKTKMYTKSDKNQRRNFESFTQGSESHKQRKDEKIRLASNTDMNSRQRKQRSKSIKNDFQHALSSSGSESNSAWVMENENMASKSNINFKHTGNQRRTGKVDLQGFGSESRQSRRNEKRPMALHTNIKADINIKMGSQQTRNQIINSKPTFMSPNSWSNLERHLSKSNNNGVTASNTHIKTSSSSSNSFKQAINKMKDSKTSNGVKLGSHSMRSMDKGNTAVTTNTKDDKNQLRHGENRFRSFDSNRSMGKTFKAKSSNIKKDKADLESRSRENVDTDLFKFHSSMNHRLFGSNTNLVSEQIRNQQKGGNTELRHFEEQRDLQRHSSRITEKQSLTSNTTTRTEKSGKGVSNRKTGFRSFDSDVNLANQLRSEMEDVISKSNFITTLRPGIKKINKSDITLSKQKEEAQAIRNSKEMRSKQNLNSDSKLGIRKGFEPQMKAFKTKFPDSMNKGSQQIVSASKGRSRQRKKDSLPMTPVRNQKSQSNDIVGLRSNDHDDLQTGFYRCLTPAGEVGREICF